MEEGTIKKLLASAKCKACGRQYSADNVEVLGHHNDVWFMSVLCGFCRVQYLVAAVVSEERVSEITPDLTARELKRFRDARQVTPDDVLDMHLFLKGFDGDFARLFEAGKEEI